MQQPANEVANATLYTGPLVRYSLLRSKTASDALRVEVVSQVAGTLSLYRADAAGQWQRVFPANAPRMPIAANRPYQIPDDPIALRGSQDKLRLVIEPGAAATFGNRLTTGSLNQPRMKALTKKAEAPAPLVVEIAIGPN